MNSWDVFETLVARRYIHPKTIFDEVGRRINDNTFREKRIAAEKATKKTEGDYWEIYRQLPEYDPNVELEVELDHLYPIVENIKQVNDGDLILSDMYLPADFIMRVLRKCGLTANVDIIVTRYGKKKGYIWNQVKQRNIKNHYGDNSHSDVASAQAHGVNGILDTKHKLTKIEDYVYNHDRQLAAWMLYTRLQCPYNGDYKSFWIDQADINLPVLVLATLELPQDKKIAFSYRDCRNWHMIYEAMTGKPGIRLDVSRKTWLEPTVEFDQYISERVDDSTVIVDLQGRGNSIESYYNGNPPHTIYIGGRTRPYIERLTNERTKSLEKHNCLDLPTVIKHDNGIIRSVINDHPSDVAKVQMAAIDSAIQAVRWFKPKPNKELLSYLVSMMQTKNFTHRNISWEKYNGL